MTVNDETANPWLADEKRLIAEAVGGGVPFFGACLGGQLLAASLGARVYPGPKPEIGLLPLFLTDAASGDPLFAVLPRELLTFQWHEDTFDLPKGAELLATSAVYLVGCANSVDRLSFGIWGREPATRVWCARSRGLLGFVRIPDRGHGVVREGLLLKRKGHVEIGFTRARVPEPAQGASSLSLRVGRHCCGPDG